MELQPPTRLWGQPGNSKPMSRRAGEAEAACCPCGQVLDEPRGTHLLCVKHSGQIERHIGRRFGRHRFGGRYSHWAEDFVSECYVKLLSPGGLDSFRPYPGRTLDDSFGAWLWGVVRFFCLNKLDYLTVRPDWGGEPLDPVLELPGVVKPQQAFAREEIRQHVSRAVAEVQAEWGTSPEKSERFETFLPFVLGGEDSYEQAQAALGVERGHAGKIKCELAAAIREAVRRQVRDTLDLEPGLDHEGIARRIDEAIQILLDEAFPATPMLGKAPKPKPDDNQAEPEQ